MTSTTLHAYTSSKPLSEADDLAKYLEIYDLEYVKLEELDADVDTLEAGDVHTLKSLKASLLRLYIIRKLFLCSLLAIPAVGGANDYARWSPAVDLLQHNSSSVAKEVTRLKHALLEDQGATVSVPTTAPTTIPSATTSVLSTATTVGHDGVEISLRKVAALSQGVRSLQAKLRLLGEELDRARDIRQTSIDPEAHLKAHYDSIGEDLHGLVQEWEDGKLALGSRPHRAEPMGGRISEELTSPVPSLGGTTETEGSPSDALRALNGEDDSQSARDLDSFDNEEVYETIVRPHRRISLTREERMAKMKDDRARMASMRDMAQANTNMLRELHSVLALRPRGAPHQRVASL